MDDAQKATIAVIGICVATGLAAGIGCTLAVYEGIQLRKAEKQISEQTELLLGRVRETLAKMS